jgi:hypothetical protein
MKLEIEITEEEIQNAIESKVKTAIAEQNDRWQANRYIKDQVSALWEAAVDKLIVEALYNSKVMREKIATEMEKKLKAQLAAVMRNAE